MGLLELPPHCPSRASEFPLQIWWLKHKATTQEWSARVWTTFREVLVLYRKREEARHLHEHGVFARFRYNESAIRKRSKIGPSELIHRCQ